MNYDAVIVGGGIAGLTAAAFLSRAGKRILLLEKEPHCGGLVNSFVRDGFTYDGGIRAFEDSGVLFPMLRQLEILIDFVPNRISVGIEDQIIFIDTEADVDGYQELLKNFYPESSDEIDQIIHQIRRIMHFMDVQYGIDNPLFLDFKKDRDYMMREIIPWMFKYAATAPKISRMNVPVLEFLRKYTDNQSLLDIISQHFFQATPAFFALSYLKLYLGYHYPRGGTGALITRLTDYIKVHEGLIETSTEISEINPEEKWVKDNSGTRYDYQRLIWSADQQLLYRLIDPSKISDQRTKRAIKERKILLADKAGNDSIYTIFLGVDLDKGYFAEKCSEHFFYTPSSIGQSVCGPLPIGEDQSAVLAWLDKYFQLTTYEISIPVMRDASLAPEGKTGLVVSVLFDYTLTKYIQDQGWYETFRKFCEKAIISKLAASVFPMIDQTVLHVFSSTPLTMAKLTNNHEGAITGWSFTNDPVPAESRIPAITKAIRTPLTDVYQAGQWTYSPSGLPISFLTGKIAADRVIRDLK